MLFRSLVADRMAQQAAAASDAQYATAISDALAAVRESVDAVEAAYPTQPESVLASLPPARVEQLRLYADLAWRGSADQFGDRVAEAIRAADRPAYLMLRTVGTSLIAEGDGRLTADPAHGVIERALARLEVAFATPRMAETQAAAAWVEQARRALNLLEHQLAQPTADELLPISFQVGSFAIFEMPPDDADAEWYADRHELIVAGALEPSSSPFVLQPSGRLERGGEEEAEATAPVRTLRDTGSRGT